jgi:toxin ParE1/3/4
LQVLKRNGKNGVKIRLAKPAEQDLEEVEAYISLDNPVAALRTVARVLEAIEYLLQFPNMGRVGRLAETRELIVSGTPFIVIYQIRRPDIYVLRILHAARKWSH